MPIVTADPEAGQGRPAINDLTQPAAKPPPLGTDILGAAFRESGPMGAVLGNIESVDPQPEQPGYNPIEAIRGSKYEQFGDQFVGDRNSAESDRRRVRIDREQHDREVMESAGWAGTVTSMGLGLLDPTTWLLPAGQTVRAARGGFSVADSAASIGVAGFVQGAVNEAVVRGTMETRTDEESAFAIGAATVLSGILGASAARVLTGAEGRNLARALERDKAALAGSTALTSPAETRAASTSMREVEVGQPAERSPGLGVRTAEDVAAANDENALAAAAGAAPTDTREARLADYSLRNIPVLGRIIDAAEQNIPGVARVTGAVGIAVEKMDPTLRIMNSRFTSARRVGADLFESALETTDNALGRATAQRGIGAAETEINLARRQTDYSVKMVLDDAWKRHVFGSAEAAPRMAAERVAWANRGGRNDGRMTMEAFREEVGKALRRGDTHEIPEVAESAKWFRANVFDPWKDRAIKSKFLPEDVEPSAAMSYFSRLYNTEKMKSRPDAFVKQTADWLEGEQTRKAGLQARLQDLDERRAGISAEGKKAAAKIERLEARQKELEARSAEREQEIGRVGRRADDLEERVGDQEAELSDLAEAIDAFHGQIRDPAQQERMAALRREVADLRKREKQSRMTPAALNRADEQELRDRFLATDEEKAFADMVIGRKNPPKEPSFVDYVAKAGGIRGSDGDVAAITGGDKRLSKKLVGDMTARTLDDWTEKLWQDFPAAFPERPEPNAVLAALDEAARGRQPSWFVEGVLPEHEARAIEMGRVAADARAEMGRLGYEDDSRLAVARFLRDHAEPVPAGPRPFDDIPESIRLESGLGPLAAEQDKIASLRDAVAAARARTDTVDSAAGRNRVRLSEAASAERANARRADALAERQAIAARYREVLDQTVRQADEMQVSLRSEMESVIQEWGGNSAREAVSALRSREKVLAEREKQAMSGFDVPAGRLSSADGAVDSAVRRILGSDRTLSRAEHEARAREIMDRIIASPDGRLPYADKSPGGAVPTDPNAPGGALARRTFQMPDELLEEWLESDAELVGKRFLRNVVPEIVLAERFGDSMLTEDIRKIMDEAQAHASGKGEAEARQIFAERDAAIRDVAAVRDRIKGTFALAGATKLRNAGRVVTALRNYNTLADLGGSTLSSVPDIAGVVFRYGLGTVFGDAWRPFMSGLAGQSEGYRLAKEQYRAMGIGTETYLATRSVAADEMSASYRPQSRLERALQTGAEKFQLVNLQAPWTDFTKTIASIVSGNEMLRAAKAVTEGTATEKQIRDLASSNIEAAMARKIWASFQGAGGNVVDGVHLPNTGAWTDRNARLAFEGAILRETNITVVTPGQEKPLWMSDPVLGLLGQHKSFVVAATQRIMLANLQRADAATLSGLVTAISAGAISTTLYALASGKELPEDANHLLKESISRSGVLGWMEEANSIGAKATGGGVDAFRLIGADKPLARFSSQTIYGQLLGPTAGKLDSLMKITRAPFAEEGWDARTTEAGRRLIVLQNLIGLRRLLNEVEDAGNEAFGIKPLERK